MGAGFAWRRWQPSRGPRGSVHVDWVAGLLWIGWQASRGLSGNLPMDWVAGIRGIRNGRCPLATTQILKRYQLEQYRLDWLKTRILTHTKDPPWPEAVEKFR